eukprot:9030019-Pyramimonas_sp.AAC.1
MGIIVANALGTFVCPIESSELGPLPELGEGYSVAGHRNRDIRRVRLSNPELRTWSAARMKLLYHSSHPESCCRFSALDSGCRGAAGL